MPRRFTSMGISSETIIANGVVPPIRMVSFPSMETIKPPRFTIYPDIAGSQIHIHAVHETDVFITIPGVTVGNQCYRSYRDRWRNDHRRRRNHDRRRNGNYWHL